jgi:hypothetical protein
MGEPVVMFCVGAAKSGTGWLYRYLSGHRECHFRGIKELHYFDSLDAERTQENRARVLRMRDDLKAEIDLGQSTKGLANKIARLADVEDYLTVLASPDRDHRGYLTYLRTGADGARVVGDLTPAYSLLSEDRLRQMVWLTSDVRFVYLLRDPVERLWSHVRMAAYRRTSGRGNVRLAADRILRRVLGGGEAPIAQRCDYAGALSRLTGAVDPRRLLVSVCEDVFHGDGLDQIAGFLGIAPGQPDLAKVVHGGYDLPMTVEQRVISARWLAPQYEAAERYLGDLPDAWRQSLARVS